MVIYDSENGNLYIPKATDKIILSADDIYQQAFNDGYKDGYRKGWNQAEEECHNTAN